MFYLTTLSAVLR